jgi:predicted nucleic acid-binding protein
MNPVFLDSAFLIALGAKDDQHHGLALRLAEKFEAEETQLVTTRAVYLELGSGLSKSRHRQRACEIFDLLESDEHVTLVEIESKLLAAARDLFCARLDKEWSLADCVSFLVMKERGISDALTTDVHFEQAGFRALLREK